MDKMCVINDAGLFINVLNEVFPKGNGYEMPKVK